MVWACLLAYVTGTVNQELLLHVSSASTECPDRLMNINFIRGIITLFSESASDEFSFCTPVVSKNSVRLQNQQDTVRLRIIVTWLIFGWRTPTGFLELLAETAGGRGFESCRPHQFPSLDPCGDECRSALNARPRLHRLMQLPRLHRPNFEPTTQPTKCDVLYDLRGVWQSPRSCKFL